LPISDFRFQIAFLRLASIGNPQSAIGNYPMSPFLFYFFAFLMLVFGAAVVVNRNPIASALSLVICFLGLSALFMSLDAFFIGIIQVLVYAGAVMVLFLFIIMLLDLRAEVRRKTNFVAFAGGIAVALAFFVQLCFVVGQLSAAKSAIPPLAAPETDDVHSVGMALFTNYTLPFQIIGVLVLVATIGVIVLSKRELR
jgi:NADH-quinone oxidoreductase subunit J